MRWKREKLICISTNLRAGQTRRVTVARSWGSCNPRTVVYDIDEKSRLSFSLDVIFLSTTWPINVFVAVVLL